MYASGNPKTKKELRSLVAGPNPPRAFSPGPFPCPTDGKVTIEGPHFPSPHSWYAEAVLKNGYIVSVK